MDNMISVIVCSKINDERKEDIVNKIGSTSGCYTDIVFMYNPDGIGLPKIYNSMLDSGERKSDIFVFVHDDVDFLRNGWGAELLRLFNEHKDYGIIGVAGSAEFDANAAWWQYKDIYGQVLHRHDGKTWLTTFSPLLKEDLKEVCVIDGLFMAVHRKRISDKFDENYSFDFYDVTFCLDNYLSGKTKIGVTTNIRLAHNSIGEMRPDWYGARERVNEKYSEFYPIKVGKK